MPSKKKKYNSRFPPARIKKIMQTDEEVGKVAAAVPVIISRALELFIESLIKKSSETTQERNAKTLSTSHIKHIIQSEKKFDFLKDLVAKIPDIQQGEEDSTSNDNLLPAAESNEPTKSASAPTKTRSKPSTSSGSEGPSSSDNPPVKRSRGRPRKEKPAAGNDERLPPKKRGRKKKEPEVPEVPEVNESDGSETEENVSENETESADEGSSEDCAHTQENNMRESSRLSNDYNPSLITDGKAPSLPQMPLSVSKNTMEISSVTAVSEIKTEPKPEEHDYTEPTASVGVNPSKDPASELRPQESQIGAFHPGLPFYAPLHSHGPVPHSPGPSPHSYGPAPHSEGAQPYSQGKDGSGMHPQLPMFAPPPQPDHRPPMPSSYLPQPPYPPKESNAPSSIDNTMPPHVPMPGVGFPGHPSLPYPPPPMSFYGSYPLSTPATNTPHDGLSPAPPRAKEQSS